MSYCVVCDSMLVCLVVSVSDIADPWLCPCSVAACLSPADSVAIYAKSDGAV